MYTSSNMNLMQPYPMVQWLFHIANLTWFILLLVSFSCNGFCNFDLITTVLLLEHIPTKCSYAGIICNQMVHDKKDTTRFKAPKTLSMKVLWAYTFVLGQLYTSGQCSVPFQIMHPWLGLFRLKITMFMRLGGSDITALLSTFQHCILLVKTIIKFCGFFRIHPPR